MLLMLFEAPYATVCGFHMAASLGYTLMRSRDLSLSVERVALTMPVVAMVVFLVVHDLLTPSRLGAVPLVGIQVLTVTSRWLYCLELGSLGELAAGAYTPSDTGGEDAPTAGTASAATNTAHFYVALGSVPLLAACAWWRGEYRSLVMDEGMVAGGLLAALAHADASTVALVVLVCVVDVARDLTASRLLAVVPLKVFFGIEIVAMLVPLVALGGMVEPFLGDAVPVWTLGALVATAFSAALFLGAEGTSKRGAPRLGR